LLLTTARGKKYPMRAKGSDSSARDAWLVHLQGAIGGDAGSQAATVSTDVVAALPRAGGNLQRAANKVNVTVNAAPSCGYFCTEFVLSPRHTFP
jgi:hypothetical protein